MVLAKGECACSANRCHLSNCVVNGAGVSLELYPFLCLDACCWKITYESLLLQGLEARRDIAESVVREML